jgi:PadR family transcriptional regulator AphA
LIKNRLTLSTGLAGAVLQKFVNYNVRAAVVLDGEQIMPVRFREMMVEQGAGNIFPIFTDLTAAVRWLQAE